MKKQLNQGKRLHMKNWGASKYHNMRLCAVCIFNQEKKISIATGKSKMKRESLTAVIAKPRLITGQTEYVPQI